MRTLQRGERRRPGRPASVHSNVAFKDEINVFRRTLLYAGLPNSSRWYEVAEPDEKAGARALIYLRRKDGVGAGDFRKFINKELVPALAGTGVLRELRTQTFLPWNKKLWDTPKVAHDNPADQRFHASLILASRRRRSGRTSSAAVISRACRTRWPRSPRPSMPTTCPRC